MTTPGKPRIKINPSKAERATLLEWLEVVPARLDLDLRRSTASRRGDMMSVIHIRPRNKICDLYGSLRLHRRDLCALADYVLRALWQPGDQEPGDVVGVSHLKEEEVFKLPEEDVPGDNEDGDGNERITGVSAPKEEETTTPTHRERENPKHKRPTQGRQKEKNQKDQKEKNRRP